MALANLPRTAATVHEISIAPLFPSVPIQATVTIYFAICLFLALDKSSLVDRIGKYMTPILLILLLIIIIKGFITPLGTPIATGQENVFGNAFIELYFTGDLLSGHMFSAIIISAILAKGYTQGKEQKKITLSAALVAAVIFVVVYGGFLVIAAGASEVMEQGTERTAVLSGMVKRLLGTFGNVALAVSVALACVSTAVTLISISANFLSRLTKEKISYKIFAVIISVIGVVIGTMGVDNIINFAGPSFMAVYPSAIVLTFMALAARNLPNIGVYRYSVIFAFVFGLLHSLSLLGLSFLTPILSVMPFFEAGFGWILPALIGGIVGYIVHKIRPSDEKIIQEKHELEF